MIKIAENHTAMIEIARKNYPNMMENYNGELLQNLEQIEGVTFTHLANRKFYKGKDGTLIAVGGTFQDCVFLVVEKDEEIDFFLAGYAINLHQQDAYLDLFSVEWFNKILL